MTSEAREIVARLTKAQREMMSGDYDPEFASVVDASRLINLGLWAYDPSAQDCESEFYELDVTSLGFAVRAELERQGNA